MYSTYRRIKFEGRVVARANHVVESLLNERSEIIHGNARVVSVGDCGKE